MNYPENRMPELLAPAGSFEHMKAAVAAGADAVYFGGTRFGARAYARNFTAEDVIRALDFLHFHGRRAYMTVNTLFKEKELWTDLYPYLLPFYEAGLDGVIVQDPGAASFIRECFPGMEIHGSTQMMITSVSGAVAAKAMGMNRVVPARELSAEEMIRIREETGLELEVFIHGALCYSYSGQCLLSSRYGGRSGNRGRCAQPCRLPYMAYDASGKAMSVHPAYFLSPKDLCSLSVLPSMIEAGVDSLKIEGRMKNVEYVAGVTAIYRKYLDLYEAGEPYIINPEDMETLEELYSRSGFTEGYWYSRPGKAMMSVDMPRHLGRKIGTVKKVFPGKVAIILYSRVFPRDILILPGRGEEEIVLTVPSEPEIRYQKKNRLWEIILNAPKSKGIKAGIPVYRRYNQKMQEKIRNEILDRELRYPVEGSIRIEAEKPITLRLISRKTEVTLTGPVPSKADKRPVSREDILRQFHKTGNVPFHLEEFGISLDPDLFVPASVLKELRQRGYKELMEQTVSVFRHGNMTGGSGISNPAIHIGDKSPFNEDESECYGQPSCHRDIDLEKTLCVVTYDPDVFSFCLSHPLIEELVIPMDFYARDEMILRKAEIHASGKKSLLSLPRVFRQTSAESMKEYLESTTVDGIFWDGVYIHNINELNLIPDSWKNVIRIYGSSFYQWNSLTHREILRLEGTSIENTCLDLPVELSGKECEDILEQFPGLHAECLVFGRFPVMLSAQCVKNTLGRCNGREEICYLGDKNGRRLAMSSHCHPEWIPQVPLNSRKSTPACYNMIWSDSPRCLIGEEFHRVSGYINRLRFDFFHCDRKEAEDALTSYLQWKNNAYHALREESSRELSWYQGIE